MALIVAGLVAQGETVVEGTECIAISYPDFLSTLQRLAGAGCGREEE
jgi:3-phosphoshikimate 1-carboxyvinyltransferase